MKANESVNNYDSKIREYVNYSYRQTKNACKETTERGAGGENEKKMQDYFVNELESCTDEVSRNEFRFSKVSAFSENICNIIVFIIAIGMAIVTSLGIVHNNTFAIIVSVVAILAGIGNIFSGITSKIFAKKASSSNIFAVKKSTGRAEKRLIILSNSDSMPIPKFKTSALVIITGIGFMLTIIVLFLSAYNDFFNTDSWQKYLPLGLLVFLPFGIATLFGDSKEYSQGASKNLSGVFTSIAVMKYMKDLGISFKNTEICILICGAHEYNCSGAKHFVKNQFPELSELPTVVINTDSLAFEEENLGYITSKSSEEAVNLIKNGASDAGFEIKESKLNKKYITDASAFSKTFYSCCTLTSLPLNYTKVPDTFEDMKIKTIETALKTIMSSVFIYDESK